MLKLILWFIYFSIMLSVHFVALVSGVVMLLRGKNPMVVLVYFLLSFMAYFFSRDTAESIRSQIEATERARRLARNPASAKEEEGKPPRPFKKEV